jgi:hypothetical protein
VEPREAEQSQSASQAELLEKGFNTQKSLKMSS